MCLCELRGCVFACLCVLCGACVLGVRVCLCVCRVRVAGNRVMCLVGTMWFYVCVCVCVSVRLSNCVFVQLCVCSSCVVVCAV